MILITGASGYVAQHTLQRLSALKAQSPDRLPWPIRALVRNPQRADKVRAFGAEGRHWRRHRSRLSGESHGKASKR